MELLLKNGDYVPDGKGGFLRGEGKTQLLQRVLWKLCARRGSFPFLPDLGSRLYTLFREKPSAWEGLARQYVAQALSDESELTVCDVKLEQVDRVLEVTVYLDWNGESVDVRVELEE